VTLPNLRLPRPRPRLAASALLVLALAGCSTTASPPRASRTPAASPVATAVPAPTAVPGGPSASTAATTVPTASTPALPSTSATEFGTIWDALPPSFPTLPAQISVDPGEGATSGTFAVPTDVATASAAIRAGLEAQGWSVDVGSPLEDGTVVLDATGPGTDCRTEVRFTPTSGTVTMSVLYGASCPFG
jgi:hypothetical protein